MTEIISHFGVKISLDKSIMSKRMISTLLNGYYENEEAEQLQSIIQENEIVMELGGGIGFISTLLARNDKVKELHIFEANPHLIDAIRVTHRLNGIHAYVYNEILGKSTKIREFYINKDFWASSTIPQPCKEIVSVNQSSFQERLGQIKPSLIIVDIEGGELELFDEVDLFGVKKIFIEIHQNIIGREGVKHLFEVLGKQGFHYDVWHSCKKVVLFSHVNRDKT